MEITYYIFTPSVCNLGGAELYTLRRAKYLENLGFRVIIVTSRRSNYFPLRKDFGDTPLLFFPELEYGMYKSMHRVRKHVFDCLESQLRNASRIYIESHSLQAIEWAEFFAARVHARHLAYPLSEFRADLYHRFKAGNLIFERKLSRNEFYGVTSVSLNLIFGHQCPVNNYVNIGFDRDEFSDVSKPRIDFKKEKEFVITTVTRLEKAYVPHLMDSVVKLSELYPKHHFILIVGGGTKTTGLEERLRQIASKYSNDNLEIRLTGYIESLGRDLFEMSDVFVGMGTASVNAISMGVPTLNIDPLTNKTSGFFGVDTMNFAYPQNGRLWDIYDKLNECFLLSKDEKKMISDAGVYLFKKEFDRKVCFSKLDAIFDNMEPIRHSLTLSISYVYNEIVHFSYKVRSFLERTER